MKNTEQVIRRLIARFPTFFDVRLEQSYYKLLSLTSHEFLQARKNSHRNRLVLAQFFLQKQMEKKLPNSSERQIYVRLFSVKPNRICLALAISSCNEHENLNRNFVLQALQFVLPGISEIPHSFFSWDHPELAYRFFYIEGDKLRGKYLSRKEMERLQQSLKHHIFYSVAPLFPPVFWPHNQEEIYQHLLGLKTQIDSKEDLPHVLIYFREQVSKSLEFLIYLVFPQKSLSLEEKLHGLPSKIQIFHHLHYIFNAPLPVEAWVFSLLLPSKPFYENGAINLLHARRNVFRDIEEIIGPFRDCNGGLFEKQQHQFEKMKSYFFGKIPHSHLFDEKIFYALKPIEAQMSLSSKTVEDLFLTFQRALNDPSSYCFLENNNIIVIKSISLTDLLPYIKKIEEKPKIQNIAHAYAQIAHFHYFCIVYEKGNAMEILHDSHSKPPSIRKKKTVLKLNFLEGFPPSLNPLLLFRDSRSKALGLFLFEGLVRIGSKRNPLLAGAKDIKISNNGCTYSFKLKPHGWSNGEKVTAFQYEQSWKRVLSSSNHSSYLTPFLPIKNVKKMIEGKCTIDDVIIHALNEETLTFEIEMPDPLFIRRLSQSIFFPTYDHRMEPNWFNGPYQITSQSKTSILLERNPFFWDKGKPEFDEIKIFLNSEPEETISLFTKGEIDWIGEPFTPIPSSYLDKIAKLQKRSTTRFFWIYLNTASPSLQSPLIRKALSLALNRNYICENILIGDDPLYTPLPSPLSFCTSPFEENYQAAQILFEQEMHRLGLKATTFPPLKLLYTSVAGGLKLAEYFAQTWKNAFGIKIFIEESPWNSFRGNLERGEYQIAGCYGTPLYEDPSTLLDRFDRLNSHHFNSWYHPLYHEKMNEVYQLPTSSLSKLDLFKELENLLVHDTPIIPISCHPLFYAHRKGLKGIIFDTTGCPDFRWTSINPTTQRQHEK